MTGNGDRRNLEGPGRLWVVATPIGNLQDLSPRAREVLAGVAAILSEDTRSVRKLLSHFRLATRAQSFHEHNELHETPRVVARLLAGEDFALVSDAGTPVLADPGYRLVRACREENIPVLAVPGPSAVVAAVSVAGLPPYPFTFTGFLPPRSGVRQRVLTELANLPHTLVVFLSPHRLANELADCSRILGGQREAVVLAELTKVHERAARGTLEELATQAATTPARGEYTLVVGPPVPAAAPVAATPEAARAALAVALAEGNDLPTARRAAARRLGITRRQLYGLIEQGDGEPVPGATVSARQELQSPSFHVRPTPDPGGRAPGGVPGRRRRRQS